MTSLTNRLLVAGIAAGLLGGGASLAAPDDFCHPSEAVAYAALPFQQATPIHVQLAPLADLLATGEGNYNSVNRGWAGDTPGGIEYIMGRTFDYYTVADVMRMQEWHLYAVGRYQFIPSTLRYAVSVSTVRPEDKFTPDVQDRLMAALIVYKRPIVITYLQGNHDNLGAVLDALAKEWASVEYRNGRSYYRRGGNRAKITRAQVAEVLKEIKAGWQSGAVLP